MVTKHVLTCLYTSFVTDDRSRRPQRGEFERQRVGHLNTILTGGRGRGGFEPFNLQKKSSNARGLLGGVGWELKFRVDRRILYVTARGFCTMLDLPPQNLYFEMLLRILSKSGTSYSYAATNI